MESVHQKMMVDPTLAEMGRNLDQAMRILGDGSRESEAGTERRRYSRTSIPGPLQGEGQDVGAILELVQNLMHGDEDEEEANPSLRRMQSVGEQGHMALLGHSLAAYISVLEKERLRRLTTRILYDTTLWLCRLFRYENGSAYFHEDDREGLVKVCRLVLNERYEDYGAEGYAALSCSQPVIYQSASSRPGLGQHVCSQLGLPLSSLCTVPCNTMFGSQHQMDVALLDKLIREDVDTGKLPLLLIANAGTPGAGHTDKLSRLREMCDQNNMWLHVEGVNLATLALGQATSSITAACKADSMTLTPGPWLGLPAVPAFTLYRQDDPALALAAGLTSSRPVEKLRALPLWLSLQYLGHQGIIHKIHHATALSQQLLEKLKSLTSIKTSDVLGTEISLLDALTMVEDELHSPVVVFRFSQESSAGSSGGSVEGYCPGERELLDTLNLWLGERLAALVPASGLDLVELEDEGTCVRFTPLMTAAVLGTQKEDVEELVDTLAELVPVLSATLRLRQDFREEVQRQAACLSYLDDLTWPGLGAIRYEPVSEGMDESKRQLEMEKINIELLKKLQELDTDLIFSTGPEFGTQKGCIFIGMATEDLDVAELVETVVSLGRDIEENGRMLENMTEIVRKGILEAELQLQKASDDKLMEEGMLRQLPVVGSVLNWFSPIQSSVKGRTFNLAAGSLDTTDYTYTAKAQVGKPPPADTPTSSAKRVPGHKLFRRPGAGLDGSSETSSVGQAEEPITEETATLPSPPAPEPSPPSDPETPAGGAPEDPGMGEEGEVIGGEDMGRLTPPPADGGTAEDPPSQTGAPPHSDM